MSKSKFKYTSKKTKKVLSAKAGCNNWQLEKYIDTETEETIEDKTKFLRQLSSRRFIKRS